VTSVGRVPVRSVWDRSFAPVPPGTRGTVRDVAELLSGRRWVALTGAGMSTDSGIPDYRGPTSIRATPMQYGEFVGSESARRRYWARSYLGWRQIGQAYPNDGHQALADLEDRGLVGLITQNVDGLHTAAGSSAVVNLHGDIGAVVCLDCGERSSRLELQVRLAALNPGVEDAPVLEHAELRPDGDAVVDDWSGFRLAGCLGCGGRLKPDVVFFGESVPKPRVQQAYDLVDRADVLVVAGSSLTVMSGLRFVRHQWKRSRPTVIINRGPTRGDEFATVKLDAGCSESLTELLGLL
jgi:NAD-dependent SIR2 family protein deacetylase